MGAVSGAVYGIAAEFAPAVTGGAGVPFGTAVWLVADDLAVPALGLSDSPPDYPASMHAYSLASHFGVRTRDGSRTTVASRGTGIAGTVRFR